MAMPPTLMLHRAMGVLNPTGHARTDPQIPSPRRNPNRQFGSAGSAAQDALGLRHGRSLEGRRRPTRLEHHLRIEATAPKDTLPTCAPRQPGAPPPDAGMTSVCQRMRGRRCATRGEATPRTGQADAQLPGSPYQPRHPAPADQGWGGTPYPPLTPDRHV